MAAAPTSSALVPTGRIIPAPSNDMWIPTIYTGDRAPKFSPAGSKPVPWLAEQVKMPTFNGANKGATLDFIQALAEYGQCLGYCELDFMNNIVPLSLRGTAKRWWIFRGPFSNWEEFRINFVRAHLAHNFRERMRKELEVRYQGEGEDLLHFIMIIDEYYETIEPWASDNQRVARVLEQALPKYQPYLFHTDCASLKDLADAVPRIQMIVHSPEVDRISPPPSKTLLHPRRGKDNKK